MTVGQSGSRGEAGAEGTAAGVAAPLVYRVVINAPVSEVWKEITRTDAPIKCFFNSRMALSRAGLVKGSKMAMRTPNGKYVGVFGEILEVVLLKKFSHTFRFTELNDPPCVLTYELREVQGGTEFTMTISGATPGTKSLKQMAGGAKIITGTLKAVLETGKPSFGVRVLYAIMPWFPVPAACRSEKWPVD